MNPVRFTPDKLTRRPILLCAIIAVLIAASLACNVPDALTNINPTAVAEVDVTVLAAEVRNAPYIQLVPSEYCPGQLVTMRWGAGPQLPDCDHASTDAERASCKRVDTYTSGFSDTTPDYHTDTQFEGSFEFISPNDAYGGMIWAEIRVHYPDRASIIRQDTSYEIGGQAVDIQYSLTCDPESDTWQWLPAQARVHDYADPVEPWFPYGYLELNTCAAIVDHSNAGQAFGATFADADGTSVSGSDLDGYTVDQVHVVPNTPEAAAVAGTACAEGDPSPATGVSNGAGVPAIFTWHYNVECSLPEDMHGASAQRCARIRPITVTAPINSDNGVTPTAPPTLAQICNLQASCGNGVCEAGCETGNSCAADCAESAGICADHGGVAWTGSICACPGVIDDVTICNDDTKFDNVTAASCNMGDPSECQQQPPPTEPPPSACICACAAWSQTAYPPTCVSWRDCNGNSCSP
jgi:hypothetical protein